MDDGQEGVHADSSSEVGKPGLAGWFWLGSLKRLWSSVIVHLQVKIPSED